MSNYMNIYVNNFKLKCVYFQLQVKLIKIMLFGKTFANLN